MHLQTLAITINQSLIGKVRLLPTMLHHTVRTQTRFFTRKGSGTFFVYQRFRGRTTRNGKQERAKAGYHRGDGILPFVLYGAFWGNRCVRRKKGKFWHIGVFFRFAVWYNRLNKSEFIKENIDETIFMFALFKCRKSDKGRN